MPRHDRKRWWETKPPPPKPKYYGIVSEPSFAHGYVMNGRWVQPIFKAMFKPISYYKGYKYHFDQKFSLEEAEALCKLLNAGDHEWTNDGA